VSWEDPLFQLSIVTDLDEWRALKARAGLSTPAEDKLVLQVKNIYIYIYFHIYTYIHMYVGLTHHRQGEHRPTVLESTLPTSIVRRALKACAELSTLADRVKGALQLLSNRHM